ncbi:YpdA family putative bacillithiol disulfide reductase [Brevibacillus ginsengisoli]|uniref:YpdA family putative bacillithiol disulfide reductase n=1 Tax=Brevibacillus ginsengisoli TaxID=363854 RepID=UPI003CE87F14
MEDVIIIGAGPCGLSAGIELRKAGFDPLLLEKGPIVNSIYQYPTYMIFHSTPELLEIGEIPFNTPNEKPTRLEALTYYRTVATRNELRIRQYEQVVEVNQIVGVQSHGNELVGQTDHEFFQVMTTDRHGKRHTLECKHLVMATGYFDHPNRLQIPGEDLPKVFSYYKEAHPFSGQKVAIVGGNNSAVDSALDLERAGAEVTVIYRGPELSSHVKAWTRPLFESMVNKGRITFYTSSQVTEINQASIQVNTPGGILTLENDYVFTLIGYRPDRTMLNGLGVETDDTTGAPLYDPETMETNVHNLFIAGVIAAGNRANSIFIENGRHHGALIAKHMKK